MLKENLSIVTNSIHLLDDYKLDDKYYSAITVINPSLLATYCGVEILHEMEKLNDNIDNIMAYLLNYRECGVLTSMSCEDIYYYYNTLLILDSNLINDEALRQETINVLLSNINSIEVLSIRELYCAHMLNKILKNNEITKIIKIKLETVLSSIEINEISMANYCMLLIIIKNASDEYDGVISQVDKIDSKLVTIMDAFYYVEYCNTYDITINEQAVDKVLKAVENDNGYYISKYQKENSMFTLFLGYSLSNR